MHLQCAESCTQCYQARPNNAEHLSSNNECLEIFDVKAFVIEYKPQKLYPSTVLSYTVGSLIKWSEGSKV